MTAARIREFRQGLQDSLAERTERSAHGVGLFTDSLPEIYELNYVRAEQPAAAAELAAEADSLMEQFLHRRVIAEAGGDPLVDGFRSLGWTATTHVVMELHRGPDRRVDTSGVGDVPFETIASARTALTAAEPWGDPLIAERLNEAKRRLLATVPMRFFAVLQDGRVAVYCELRSRGGVAQIEDVNTMPEFRGRGLGRIIVQHALDQARPEHDLVFLEALEDDWPRELYAKLGFDVVDRRHLFLLPPSPLTRLRLRTPRLELRLPTVAELRSLAKIARGGIHSPDEMPFEVAWTDKAGSPSFVADFIAYHRDALRTTAAERWRLELVAFLDGRPVGVQGLGAEEFGRRREVSTGSWLGSGWQGRGLGTEMRSAALVFAFDGLGAKTAVSAAWEHNLSSLGVSRKLGYQEAGTKLAQPRGEPIVHRVLRLERAAFRSPVPVEIAGLETARPLLLQQDPAMRGAT